MSGLALPRHPKPAAPVTALANSILRYERALSSLQDVTESYSDTLGHMQRVHDTLSAEVSRLYSVVLLLLLLL